MKKLFTYLIRVNKALLFGLIAVIITYFLIELVLNSYSEIFPGAHVIGQFFSILSISYIASFIFYFIVVHIKSEADKENINEYVGQKVYSIIRSAHLFIQPLQQTQDKNAKFEDLDTANLGSLLKSIKRNSSDAPYIVNDQNATWLEWFEYLKTSTQDDIKEVFVRYNHLDSKLIRLLTRIENSMFFYQWNLLYNFQYGETFGIYQLQIQSYLTHIKELEEYAQKHFKKYQYRTHEFMGTKQLFK